MMKKCLLLLIALALIFQISAAAAYEDIPLDPAVVEEYGKYEDAKELITGDMATMGFLTYLAGVSIYAQHPDLEVMMNAAPLFGAAEFNAETAMLFFLPLVSSPTDQRYRMAFYEPSSQKLMYQPDNDMTAEQAFAMLNHMCGEDYTFVTTDSLAETLRRLDEFAEKVWPGKTAEVTGFLKGIRPAR